MSNDKPSIAPTINGDAAHQIRACLDGIPPTSFFLLAGAGSGKTRLLVDALNHLRSARKDSFAKSGQKIGVITYTRAAADEIRRRSYSDPIIDIATIHSFSWSLIRGFNDDIRAAIRQLLLEDLDELTDAQKKGRAGKASAERIKAIAAKQERLSRLDGVRAFSYSPSGLSHTLESLSHAEVLQVATLLLTNKPTLRTIITGRYPFIFVDEAQDTNAAFLNALLQIQAENEARLCVGLFGDMMQRIYTDGLDRLQDRVPQTWQRPAQFVNHRSPKRIVQLVNRIRAASDGHSQTTPPGSADGSVRFFLASSDSKDKFEVEHRAALRMADIARDPKWRDGPSHVKTLTLEHHMAARRMGFAGIFDPLYSVERIRTGLLDGSLPAIRFIIEELLPLIEAARRGDSFTVANQVQKHSPLVVPTGAAGSVNHLESLHGANVAVQNLLTLWRDGSVPNLRTVLNSVSASRLLEPPYPLGLLLTSPESPSIDPSEGNGDEARDMELAAWDHVLNVGFDEAERYARYLSGESQFGTHQGVKGLEFPRVMVVIDDEEARGFLFSYDKLFGATPLSKADLKNELDGKDNSVDRTRRLFYVTCSRAKQSLAIVYYTSHANEVRGKLLADGWFTEDELETL